MKNTEIRIGNYVYRNDILVTVDEQTFWDMKNNPEQYNPVPLTEEWLFKFDFSQLSSNIYSKGFFEVHFVVDSFYFRSYNVVKVKSVHELQNAYFAQNKLDLKLKS
jgi:hypothetical protein